MNYPQPLLQVLKKLIFNLPLINFTLDTLNNRIKKYIFCIEYMNRITLFTEQTHLNLSIIGVITRKFTE